MPAPKSDHERIVGFMNEAYKGFIKPRWESGDRGILTQDPADPAALVTLADTEAEVFLTEKLRAAYPMATIIGEETYKNTPDKDAYLKALAEQDLVFTLDPVDGTNYFVKNDNRFATVVGQWQRGVIQNVWIMRHAVDLLVYACKGEGTFIARRTADGAWPVGVRVAPLPNAPRPQRPHIFAYPRADFTAASVAALQPLSVAGSLGQAGELTDYLLAHHEAVCAGRSLDYEILFLKGSPDLTKPKASTGNPPWDSAIILALLEVGGYVANLSSPADPNRYTGLPTREVFSSSRPLGQQAQARLYS